VKTFSQAASHGRRPVFPSYYSGTCLKWEKKTWLDGQLAHHLKRADWAHRTHNSVIVLG